MQITVLIQVINYLKEISADPSLLEGYKRLSEVIRDASKNNEGDFSGSILKEKEQLCRILLESDPEEWGYASYSLFEKIDSNELFGKAAVGYLQHRITPQSKDFHSIYSDLTKKIKLISKLSETINKFQQLFDQVVPAIIFQPIDDNEKKSSLFLYFEGDLSVQNISDLERYSRLWDRILSTFSKLTGEANLSLDINNFSNNNIVLGVSIEDNTISALAAGVTGIVSSLPLILKIRKIQSEILNFSLYSDLNDLLEEEITNVIDQSAWVTAKNLSSTSLKHSLNEEDMTNELFIALKQILSFIEKGGKIEFTPLISDPEVNKTNKLLIESFPISRELNCLKELSDNSYIKRVEQFNSSEVASMESVT